MNYLRDLQNRFLHDKLNDLEAGIMLFIFGAIVFSIGYWIFNSYKKRGYNLKNLRKDASDPLKNTRFTLSVYIHSQGVIFLSLMLIVYGLYLIVKSLFW